MGVFNFGSYYARARYTLFFCVSKQTFVSCSGGDFFMAQCLYPDRPFQSRKACRFILAFFWISGLICGFLVYLSAETSLVPLMHSILSETVSIVSLLCVTALPFLLSIFMVFFSKPWLILPICFCKAFLFSFVSIGILQLYGSAGWLIRFLLLFSDCVTVPFLYWFWLRCLTRTDLFFGCTSAFLLALGFLIGSMDYRIISPVLARLIEF